MHCAINAPFCCSFLLPPSWGTSAPAPNSAQGGQEPLLVPSRSPLCHLHPAAHSRAAQHRGRVQDAPAPMAEGQQVPPVSQKMQLFWKIPPLLPLSSAKPGAPL